MKTSKTIAILALATALLSPLSHANLLAVRAKLETAKSQAEAAATANPTDEALVKAAETKAQALTTFDTGASEKFGSDWAERWQNSDYANPDDEAADIYISGKVFVPSAHPHVQISGAKQREILAHIAAKPELVREDLAFVQSTSFYSPEVAARIDGLAAFLPSRGIRGEEYFGLKHITLLKKPNNGIGNRAFTRHMTLAEWFDLASSEAHFSPDTFNAMRNAIIATTARLLIDKRRAEGLPVEGEEFNAAFAPVLDAIKAPKFNGLEAAVSALGINFVIPTPDFSAQVATAELVAEAATRNATFLSAWDSATKFQDGLGSVMFVMGEAAYREWREALLQPR
jgi:hypothetical protein